MMFVWIIVYLCAGLLLLYVNSDSAWMYFFVFPFHVLLVRYFYKRKRFVLTCVSIYFLISMGVNPIFFFLSKERIISLSPVLSGMNINALVFFQAYIKVLLFVSILWLVDVKNRETKFLDIFGWTNNYIRSIVRNYKTSSIYNWALIIALFIMSSITIWMYNNNIGILGLFQRELPFHLTGFLFYLRRFGFAVLIIVLYIKCRNKSFAFIACCIYAFICGITSCSKSVPLLFLIPLVYESYVTGKTIRGALGLLYCIFLYAFISLSRSYIFMFDKVEYAIPSLISLSWKSFSTIWTDYFLVVLESFTGRLHGAYKIVLCDQYKQMGLYDMLMYYLGVPMSTIIPDFSYAVFGIKLPDDKAYGVNVGYTGFLILLSKGKILLIIIQALYMSFLFNKIEKLLIKFWCVSYRPNIKILAIGYTVFTLLLTMSGTPFYFVYINIFVLWAILNTDLFKRTVR